MTRCPTCGAKPVLSDPQRDRYFALLQGYCQHPKMLAQGVRVTGLHDYLAELFLPPQQISRPDGLKLVRRSVSRSKGPPKEVMSEFMDKVEAWANDPEQCVKVLMPATNSDALEIIHRPSNG